MKMLVTLRQPAVVDVANLAAFLGMAGVEAVVAPCADDTDTQTVPVPAVETVAKPASTGRRGRPPAQTSEKASKPEPEKPSFTQPPAAVNGDQAKDDPPFEPDTKTGTVEQTASNIKVDELQERFTNLVDKDYDAAVNLLQEFDIGKFSELDEKRFTAFAVRLTSLDV